MTVQKISKPRSPEKRVRSRDELEEQAGIFGRDWRAGDRVMTWLNRHEGKSGELSLLVEDGWSWADIGRAMHLAGIAYRSGEPISAAILRKKASEARAATRAKNARALGTVARDTASLIPLPVQDRPPPLPSPNQVSVQPGGADFPIEDENPAFRPATLIGHSGQELTEIPPPLPKQPAPAPEIDVAAVLARFTGRKIAIPHKDPENGRPETRQGFERNAPARR
jgi:hypothetical protein